MTPLLAIDTETGGLDPFRHALLSLAAFHPTIGGVYYHILPAPGKLIDREAARVNGYTPELWEKKGAVSLPDAMASFQHWLESISLRFSPLAHHAGFDRSFLSQAAVETGALLPQLNRRWECSQAATAFMIRAGMIDAENASLDGLCAWAGIPRPPVHDALADAQACFHGYAALLRTASSPRRLPAVQTLTDSYP